MKKYILVLAAVVVTSVVYSQKNKVLAAYNYNKAFEKNRKCSELKNGVEAINLAIAHETTKEWAKTWKYRGDLYFNILASKDASCKAIDADALDKCRESYFKATILNFQDPELRKIDLMKEDGSGLMAYGEAMKSNPKLEKSEYQGIPAMKFPGLAGEYVNKGIAQFGKKNYKGAQESFGMSMLLNQFVGKLDTVILYNTALASEYAEDFDAAKQLYDGLIMMKYNVDGNGADLYRSMSRIYKTEGNNEKAAEYISKGRKAYPDNNNLIVEELEGFLQSGNHQEALTNLNTAITNDPSNVVLYFARGTVYENLKEIDKAVTDYKKALELKPDYYDAAFNLGAFYFNSGADKINESNKLPLSATKKYDALKAAAKKDFETAVPYIEAAHKAKPSDGATGEMLANLYTHTGQYEKATEIRAKFK